MRTNLTSILENNLFKVVGIYAKYSKSIRVDVKRIHHEADQKDFESYWIDKEYFKRKFPIIYNNF